MLIRSFVSLIVLIVVYVIVFVLIAMLGLSGLKYLNIALFSVIIGYKHKEYSIIFLITFLSIIIGMDFLHVKLIAFGVPLNTKLSNEIYANLMSESIKSALTVFLCGLLGGLIRKRLRG